jgi:hypothetical protein
MRYLQSLHSFHRVTRIFVSSHSIHFYSAQQDLPPLERKHSIRQEAQKEIPRRTFLTLRAWLEQWPCGLANFGTASTADENPNPRQMKGLTDFSYCTSPRTHPGVLGIVERHSFGLASVLLYIKEKGLATKGGKLLERCCYATPVTFFSQKLLTCFPSQPQ